MMRRSLFLALAAMSIPSAGPGQEPAPSADVSADSIEVVDRIAAVVGDTVILYTESLESLLQALAQGADIPAPGTAACDSVARETVEELVDQILGSLPVLELGGQVLVLQGQALLLGCIHAGLLQVR